VRIPSGFSCGDVSTARVYENGEIGDGMGRKLAHCSHPGAVLKRSECSYRGHWDEQSMAWDERTSVGCNLDPNAGRNMIQCWSAVRTLPLERTTFGAKE
jgi:hypothetical protein